jgi:hypothetical protein
MAVSILHRVLVPKTGEIVTMIISLVFIAFVLDRINLGVSPDDWYVQAAYVAGWAFAKTAKILAFLVLVWLLMKFGKRLQLRGEHHRLLKIGTAIYGLGYVICVYLGGWAIYMLCAATISGVNAHDAIAALFAIALIFWVAGRGIRYAVGG